MKKPQKISGTREWAVANVNCCDGCSHNCRYCYARAMAMRFNRIDSPQQWATEKVRVEEVSRNRHYRDGQIMFPTTHDITPGILNQCLIVIEKLLVAGNKVLIVSKPHLQCVEAICNKFADYKDKILFRFTIGCFDDVLLGHWEPSAPHFLERLASLRHAFNAGFQTSVSVEPMLDSENIFQLYDMLESFVTDAVWIGKMNKVRTRVVIAKEEDERQVKRIEDGQTDEKILAVYEQLKGRSKVKWKESIKEVVGLELAEEVGADE